MEEDKELLYLQLHKLSAINSDKELEHIVDTLWRTRKTGLSPPSEKAHIIALLDLIRKCVHHNLSTNELSKVFPSDLPIDLQSSLATVFQKYQNQWEEEVARDQLSSNNFLLQMTYSGMPPPLASLSSSKSAISLCPQQACTAANAIGASVPTMTDVNLSYLSLPCLLKEISVQIIRNKGSPRSSVDLRQEYINEALPCLKSMTWTLNNQRKTPTTKVALISLKLQDYTKSPLGGTEVKFQLTRDTLEAMLKSMTYVNEQLSKYVGTCSAAPQKKQRK